MEIEPIDRVDRLEADVATLDRRRPGRRNDISPALIPLLRGKGDTDARPDAIIWASAPKSEARGVFMGLLISILIFGMVGLAMWLAIEGPVAPINPRPALVYPDSEGFRVYRAPGWRAAARKIKSNTRIPKDTGYITRNVNHREIDWPALCLGAHQKKAAPLHDLGDGIGASDQRFATVGRAPWRASSGEVAAGPIRCERPYAPPRGGDEYVNVRPSSWRRMPHPPA